MAKYIVQNCKETIPWWHTFSGGQLFNSDGYNIIVRDGQCDGAGAKLIKREVCTPFPNYCICLPASKDLIAEINGRTPNSAAENDNTGVFLH